MTQLARPRMAALATAFALTMVACGGSTTLTISDPWSRAVPRVSEASSIFFEISNGLESAVTLVGGSSDACVSMEMHETSIDENRVMAMRPLANGLVLRSGDSANLEPLGMHLMCIDPTVFEGSFSVIVEIEGAPNIEIVVSIEDR